MGIHPLVKPFPANDLAAAHTEMGQFRNPADPPNKNVLHVAFRTAQDFGDLFDGQDVRCVLHVPLCSARPGRHGL